MKFPRTKLKLWSVVSSNLTTIPLLPAGEGRGEGESVSENVMRFMERASPLQPRHEALNDRPIENLRRLSAFTLMEVMIAIAVFCIGVFAILGLVASVMRGARLLDKPMVDAGAVASQISLTNSIVEVQGASGDLREFLGDTYKGYDYVYEIHEEQSNHLYHATIAVTSDAPNKPVISKMDVLLFRPLSPAGSLDSGYMQH